MKASSVPHARGFIALTVIDADSGTKCVGIFQVSKIQSASDLSNFNAGFPEGAKSMIALDVRNAIPCFVEEDLGTIAILINKSRG